MNRPPIGARVRLLANVGIPELVGQAGRIVAHHEDGIASVVELDADRVRWIVDPTDVELFEIGGAPPYTSSGDAQPARIGSRP